MGKGYPNFHQWLTTNTFELMEKIILCSDGSTFSETNYQYGAWFAQQCRAPIEVLYLSESRRSQRKLKNLSGSIGFNASEALLERIVQV